MSKALNFWTQADSVVLADALRAHVLKHAAYHRSRNHGTFYTVTTEMKVFKMARDYKDRRAIVALTIPVGARFYMRKDGLTITRASDSNCRKMRATEAIVHSIWRLKLNGEPEKIRSAYSKFDREFVYKPGNVVKPKHKFSPSDDECESGIHFFVNFRDAWYY